jgi:hypothetical protein
MSLNNSMPGKVTDGSLILFSDDLQVKFFRITRAKTADLKDATLRQDKFNFTLPSRYPNKFSTAKIEQNGMVTSVKGEKTKFLLVPAIADKTFRRRSFVDLILV